MASHLKDEGALAESYGAIRYSFGVSAEWLDDSSFGFGVGYSQSTLYDKSIQRTGELNIAFDFLSNFTSEVTIVSDKSGEIALSYWF